MSDKEEKKVLSAEVLAISKAARAAISIDKTSGVAAEKEGSDLFKENLPEGLSMDTVKAVSNYKTNFVAGTAHALGTLAVEAMASNKKLEEVSASIAMGGRDKANFTVHRRREFTNRFDPNGGKVVKLAPIAVTLEERHGKNGGQLKIARAQVSELAMAKLKN